MRKLCSTSKSSTKPSNTDVITGPSTGGLGAQTAIELAAASPKAAEGARIVNVTIDGYGVEGMRFGAGNFFVLGCAALAKYDCCPYV